MRAVSIATFCLLLFFNAGLSLAESDEICCTWVNANYGTDKRPQKLIFNYDGTYNTYSNETSTDPIIRGLFQIVKKWKDPEGISWYKIKMMNMYGTKYKLARINKLGNQLEFVCKPYKYPERIDTNEADYCSYMRASAD